MRERLNKAITSGEILHPGYDKKVRDGVSVAWPAQTINTLNVIQNILKEQGLAMSDVVQMRVYLVPDPATGKADFAGMNDAYRQFFGTKEQPNKPVRATIITSLVVPMRWWKLKSWR